jgi:hypothetical protein
MIIRIREESIRIRRCLYEAVRRCWRADKEKAEKADYVLVIVSGLKEKSLEVKAVYKPECWYYLDKVFCKEKKEECKEFKTNTDLCRKCPRIAFEGKEVKETNYLHKLIPLSYFPLQNPIRYTYK